mgnify:FL=1
MLEDVRDFFTMILSNFYKLSNLSGLSKTVEIDR